MRTRLLAYVAALALLAASCRGDSRPDDAGSDVPETGSACVVPADCDDTVFCNGVETCVAGACVPGAAPRCDDGIVCTLDACDADDDACTHDVPDADEDGHGDATCLDAENAPLGDDCDDADRNRFPGNVEFCDASGHDEDCDDATIGAKDEDADGLTDARCCNGANCGVDCDDTRAGVRPGAVEVCNALDDDCNGQTDDGVSVAVYPDLDFDGHGDENAAPVMLCAGAVGYATSHDDCDDDDEAVFGGQAELCDGEDNDCDGDADETMDTVTWYRDFDGDRFGRAASGTRVDCAPLAGYVLRDSDCDDDDPGIHPGVPETCDGRDQNCNGVADFRLGVNDFEDDDADGVADIDCGGAAEDCDDTSARVGAGESERCDGNDNDCDGEVDENSADREFYRDLDDDGFGSRASGSVLGCLLPLGYMASGGDCDDADDTIAPSASETCDSEDDDCDGATDEGTSICAATNGVAACESGSCVVTGCDDGFVDCRGGATDGCETALGTASDCGACGDACAPSGTVAASSCDPTSRACRIDACQPGRADCNGSRADGCEVDTTADGQHCGSCNNTCTVAYGNAACVSGQCLVGGCFGTRRDCNSSYTDGCETETNTSLVHCGACGAPCDVPLATESCTFGECELVACDPGFGDCDGLVSSGCETEILGSNNQHCGGCGVMCLPGFGVASAFCNAGVCEIGSCNGGSEDCNGNPSDGCERNTDSDVQHCGGCDIRCEALNRNVLCVAGDCVPGGCFPNYGNCDGSPDGSCETHTAFDLAHCGGCNMPCVKQHGYGSCVNASCIVGGCEPGYGDCDDAPLNGCETDIVESEAHCGACSHTCGGGGRCSEGACDPVVGITLGEDHTCLLRRAGGIACMGRNDLGQVGAPGGNRNVPTAVGVPEPVVMIVAGDSHTCALRVDGRIDCWGSNQYGQLGTGSTSPASSATPLPVAAPGAFTWIAAGRNHTCAIDELGTLWCWGRNESGQLGIDVADANPHPTPTVASSSFKFSFVAAGGTHTCAALDGVSGTGVTCWGSDALGQLGNGAAGALLRPATSGPELVTNDGTVSALALGDDFTCMVRGSDSNRVACFGAGGLGQLGNGATPASVDAPISITSTTGTTSLVAGRRFACAVSGGGAVQCWGALTDLGRPSNLSAPASLPGLGPLNNAVLPTTASGASSHMCAGGVATGSVRCLGLDAFGEFASVPSTYSAAIGVTGLGE